MQHGFHLLTTDAHCQKAPQNIADDLAAKQMPRLHARGKSNPNPCGGRDRPVSDKEVRARGSYPQSERTFALEN